MSKEEFKKKWLTDSFFFVENKEQFYQLQKIGVKFGLKNPIGETDLITYDMHDVSKTIAPKPNVKVAKNLTFFPDNRFQQSCFWVRDASYGEPKNFDTFIEEYKQLTKEEL